MVEKVIYSYYDNKRIKNIMNKCDVISFDLFDTLVKRKCFSADKIFEELGKYVFDTYRIEGFKKIRIDTEKQVRKFHNEVTIFDIYESMIIPETAKEDILKKEIEIELENIEIKESGFRLYLEAIGLGKIIVITTDMYLPRNVIEDILNSCNYINYSRLFLSSEIGKRKRTGDLYRYLRQTFDDSTIIMHIGDSFYSDYVKAIFNRINYAVLVKKYE